MLYIDPKNQQIFPSYINFSNTYILLPKIEVVHFATSRVRSTKKIYRLNTRARKEDAVSKMFWAWNCVPELWIGIPVFRDITSPFLCTKSESPNQKCFYFYYTRLVKLRAYKQLNLSWTVMEKGYIIMLYVIISVSSYNTWIKI